jgi:hypothetical protein
MEEKVAVKVEWEEIDYQKGRLSINLPFFQNFPQKNFKSF